MANSDSGESVVERVVRILDAFTTRRSALTVADIARHVDLPRTTTQRLCRELADTGLLARGDDHRYRLGRRLWELGTRGSPTASLTEIALPFMEDVHSVVRQHTTLAVIDADEVLYLHRLSSHSPTINITTVAGRLPIHACSSGLVLLAYATPEYQRRIIDRPLPRFTDRTPTTAAEVRRLMADVRVTGFSSVPGIITTDSTGVAVPVVVGDRAIAALNVIVHRGDEDLRAIVPALKTAAGGIARSLRERGVGELGLDDALLEN